MASAASTTAAPASRAESNGNAQAKSSNGKPKGGKAGSKRPNYAAIHSRPLPFDVYPLPAFVPHNPLSLLRLISAFISQSLWPQSSRPDVYEGYFSSETQSVHITDPKAIRTLWEAGFFGKGSLSRSEPRWLDQEKRRLGLVASQTSEEVTRKRREDRRQFKLERARKEREAIEQQLIEEGKLKPTENIEEASLEETDVPASDGASVVADMTSTALDAANDEIQRLEEEESPLDPEMEIAAEEPQDQEHLQLTLEEAFFLIYALGTLKLSRDGIPLPAPYLFRLFCTHSNFPAEPGAEAELDMLFRLMSAPGATLPSPTLISAIQPDNPFIMKYVVYHHFRSLGWVVRPGVKFAVDYLLYNRGPVFAHAEFAIIILPSYSHRYWSQTAERESDCRLKERKDWWWLHRVNRVQTQVQKTLALVYVDIPPPFDTGSVSGTERLGITNIFKLYTVREFILRRWTPNKNRD